MYGFYSIPDIEKILVEGIKRNAFTHNEECVKMNGHRHPAKIIRYEENNYEEENCFAGNDDSMDHSHFRRNELCYGL